jgi:prophage regulatory protein
MGAKQVEHGALDALDAEKAGLRTMLSLEQILARIPISSVTLWRLERDGLFPKGTFISANTKIWWLDEIFAWQRAVDGQARGVLRKPKKAKAAAVEAETKVEA